MQWVGLKGGVEGCVFVWDQVRKVAEQNGVDVSEQIQELEERAKQVRCRCCEFELEAFVDSKHCM